MFDSSKILSFAIPEKNSDCSKNKMFDSSEILSSSFAEKNSDNSIKLNFRQKIEIT